MVDSHPQPSPRGNPARRAGRVEHGRFRRASEFGDRLPHLAAGGYRPAIDDVSVMDDDQLVGEIHGRADVVRNDLDAIADAEPALRGGKRYDAMFLTEPSDRGPWVSDDVAVTRVAGAGIERKRF